jgi:diguanylate cyclase (GGDEF)-like protein
VVASCLSLCAIAIESWETREKVNKLAFTDALTGLGNRTKLTEKLPVTISRARDVNERVVLLYVDLDDFKAVNDLHGHTMGDVLLAQVATRLKAITSGADMVVRWGVDQFLVTHKTARGSPAIGHVAQQIVNGLRGRYELDTGLTVSITVSVGVSRFPDDGADLDELVARADTALQFAKSRGRGRCATFEPFMEREQTARRSFEKDVAQAVERKEISVVYQPQANAQSGSIEGFEALVRWRHPTRGLVPPSEFIPAAEACGAIAEIGACALKTACREAASWKAPLRVAVNVSPAQIVNADFSRVVEETLRDTWLDPQRLEVEVTESLFIRDGDAALATLQRLKSHGVGVAIDDFGTGYSTLSTLRSVPFDRLKIDRSFVSDMMSNAAASAIVVSVLGLGHAMGLLVVAEGVETRSQFEVLRSLGCDIVQGHLIGKPLAIEAYEELTSGRVTRFSAGDSDGVPSGPMSP